MIAQRVNRVSDNPATRQFVKFCVVGVTSAAIDFAVLNLLHFALHLPLLVAVSAAFLCGVTNGFIWNRRWTFREGAQDIRTQYPKFVLTNLVGYAMNVSIMTLCLWLGMKWGLLHTQMSLQETGLLMISGAGRDIFTPKAVNIAKLIATVFVVAWNFTASKFWTFKTAPVPNP